MKALITKTKNLLLGDEYSLKGKIFNVLAIAGACVSLIMGIVSFVSNGTNAEIIINFAMIFFALALLLIHIITKNYNFCSSVTVIAVFVFGFSAIFFSNDGYTGGMPSFFVFAIVFTVFLIEGKTMVALVVMEYITFICISFYAYYNPQSISAYRNDYELLLDIIFAFVSVSFILSTTMYIQFMLYKRQQKQLENAIQEAEKANSAKSSFLANMSHEIRTPINIIIGMNELVARDSHSEKIKEYVKKIKAASELLNSLVNNTLDMVKIESGKIEILSSEYNIVELLSEIELYSRALCEKKNLKFSLDSQLINSDALIGDALAIKQVLLNIINNAVKYTESGEVILKASKSDASNGNTMLHFAISDTGRGIKKEDLNKIFESFARVESNKGKYIQGVGLGLSIVKQLLFEMNGEIKVQSSYGKGSTFFVNIPQLNVKKQSEKVIISGKKMLVAPDVHILAVDDNEENLLLITSLLKRTFMKIDTAQNASDCLKLVKENDYDIILMDYMMPETDGVALLKLLKQNPAFNTKTIAVTANVVFGTKEFLLENGFCEYVKKPIVWNELELTLASHLPKDKYRIVEVNNAEEGAQHAVALKKISAELAKNYVDYESGTNYFSGNITAYYKAVCAQQEHAVKTEEKLNKLFVQKNFDELFYVVHSIKSSSKNIGAKKLFQVSTEIETLCTTQAYEEIEAQMPYFLYLYKLYKNALLLIKEQLSNIECEENLKLIKTEKGNLHEALVLIKSRQRKTAENMLLSFLQHQNSNETQIILNEIIYNVQNLEFEKAISLTQNLIEKLGD